MLLGVGGFRLHDSGDGETCTGCHQPIPPETLCVTTVAEVDYWCVGCVEQLARSARRAIDRDIIDQLETGATRRLSARSQPGL